MSQTIGTLPQVADNTIRRKPSRKGGRKTAKKKSFLFGDIEHGNHGSGS